MSEAITNAGMDLLDHVADGVYVVDPARRILRWNKSAQGISGFASEEVKGHCCADNILTHVDDAGRPLCKNRCPLAFTLQDGQPREATVNLHHKDGHRVPVHISVTPLRNEAGQIVAAVETFRECSDVIAMRSSIEHLKQLACTDVPTGLPQRRIAELQLAQRVQELQRFGWPFGVLLVEVDFVPQLEVRWGREGAVQAVRMAAMSVANSLRSLDTVARWDDVTFIALVANAAAGELASIAERVRMMVDSAYRDTGDGEMHVTVSVGAVCAESVDTTDSLMVKAQRSLYESRTKGRNRVTIYKLPTLDTGPQ